MNQKAQTDTGPLQKLMIVVVLVAAATTGWLLFFNGVSDGYGVTLSNESSFSQFEQPFADVQNTTQELNEQLTTATGLGDIISIMLTGGFSALIDLLLAVPQFMTTLIVSGMNALGLGAFTAYASTIVLIIVIFAIIAIIMKVRA